VLGYLEKKDYVRVIGNKYKVEMENKIKFLKSFRIFKHMKYH